MKVGPEGASPHSGVETPAPHVEPRDHEPEVPHDGTSFGATFRACGVNLQAVTIAQATAQIVDAAVFGEPLEVHLCNAYTLSLVDDDPDLAQALASGYNLPDGAPVAWLGRNAGTQGPIRGASLVQAVLDAGRGPGVRHFFYGGCEGVAAEMVERLTTDHPGLQVAGYETPPFTTLTDAELTELALRIREVGTQIVWVGLGTPKQDHLVRRLAPLVGVPVIPVGAAFDFFAGRVEEAPEHLHGTGLEWMHRFAQEPGRLWKRYLIGNPKFVARTVVHAARDKRQAR